MPWNSRSRFIAAGLLIAAASGCHQRLETPANPPAATEQAASATPSQLAAKGVVPQPTVQPTLASTDHFAEDKAAKLIAAYLSPAALASPAPLESFGKPVAAMEPALSVRWEVAAPAILPEAQPIALALPALRSLPPALKEAPDDFAEVAPPARFAFAGVKLVKVDGPNVREPAPLPIQSKPLADRVPLVDTSIEASVAIILKDRAPQRTQPLPMQRLALPEPFEHAETIQVRQPIPEVPEPPLMTPRFLPK